jgi:diguanylate cyclase (GGDEF)-like protein
VVPRKKVEDKQKEINVMFSLFSEYLLRVSTDRETPLNRKDFETLLKIAVDNLSFVHSGSVLWTDEDGDFTYLATYNHDYQMLKKIRFSPKEMLMRRFRHVYVIKRRSVDLIKELANKLNEDDDVLREKVKTVDNIKAFISIPVKSQRKILGFFNLDTWEDEDVFERYNFETTAVMIGSLLSIAMERFELIRMLKKKNIEVEKISVFDSLTDLPNLKFLNSYFEKYSELSKRLSSKLYLIYFDVRDFSKINNIYGYDFGDDILKRLSKAIIKTSRKSDVVAKVGGDDFVILSLSKETPYALKKRIEENVKHLCKKIGVELEIQFGISEYITDGKDLNSLISKAQENLYLYNSTDFRNVFSR